jgi:outer membrane receptor protein involved in Fe transport
MASQTMYFTLRPITAAILTVLAAPVFAQAVAEQKEDKKNQVDMERIVVTASPTGGVTTMRSSVSVSTLSADQIQSAQAQSAAEALRSVPGIRSESSGGEGNANVTVRGVPISAGGARYVQFQENGLPVMLFGDIAFATSDMFLRVDGSLDRLQVVRGGSASTMATNSPGGVLNFITKNGSDKGGSIGVSAGLGFDQQRFDFDYGTGKSANGTSIFFGGHYRIGEGARPAGINQEQGGQIQGSVTQQIGTMGYVRLNLKALDDRAPTNLPVPVYTSKAGKISEVPGIDPRKASPYSPAWVRDVSIDKNNNLVSTDVNSGLSVKNNAIGLEAVLDVGNGWTLDERFRKSEISGRFVGVFPFNNLETKTYKVASGADKGATRTGLVTNAAIFNTSIDDLGSITNEIKLTKKFALGGADSLNVTGGLFANVQDVALTWHFNHYLMEAKGEKPALVDTGNPVPGLVRFQWGNCCTRAIDAQYKTIAPYLALGYEAGPLNVDASVRFDKQNASGSFNQGTDRNPTDPKAVGTAADEKFLAANLRTIDYDVKKTSFSIGGNYRITSNLAAFARISEGVAFNADRIMYNSYELNGNTPIPVNTVKQIEGGVKWREGNFNAFVTLFNAKTSESNYEATTRISTSRKYDANGLELEASYAVGEFRLAGGATFTNAKIKAAEDASIVGKKPRRQADFVYQLTPSYSIGDVTLGASIIGTSKSWGDDGNTITLPAYAVLNAFVNYQAMTNLQIGLGVNNLTNAIGYTEIEGDGHAARSINGRTVKATLKYSF